MATQLFLTNTVADTHLGTDSLKGGAAGGGVATSWTSRALATSRGSGVTASFATPTATLATDDVQPIMASSGVYLEWISPPVAADVTISGTITTNLWASESNMSANMIGTFYIDIIRANATATRNSNTLVQCGQGGSATEIAVTTRGVLNATHSPLSVTANRGDRIRVVVGGAGASSASGFTWNIGYNGTSAAADGDTYVTFTENFSFESAPAGSVLYLTNTHSGLASAPVLISDFTGSDENPLSEGGNWANVNSSGNALQRVSNAVACVAAGVGTFYWTPANFGADLEAYCTLSTIGAGKSGIAARIQGEGGAFTWDGYWVTAGTGAGSTSIGIITNGVVTDLIAITFTWLSGDKLGLRIEGNTIQLWRQATGSSDWNLMLTAVNTTYASAGKIGVVATSTTVRVDDFYAATDSNLFTQKAWTSRGAGVVSYQSDTDAGWTAPLYTHDWYTPGLTAFTLTGMAQANIRALESNASANASLRCELARVDADGTSPTVWASWCCAPTGTDNGELTTSEVARTINVSGDDLAFTDGQRIRIRLYNEDISSAAMGNAFNVQPYFNGTSGGASGDSYVTLPQSVTEFSPAVLVLEHGFVNFNDPGVL